MSNNDFTDIAADLLACMDAIREDRERDLDEAGGTGELNANSPASAWDAWGRGVEARELGEELYTLLRREAKNWDCLPSFEERFLPSS